MASPAPRHRQRSVVEIFDLFVWLCQHPIVWSCDPIIWFSDHVIPSFYHVVLPCDLASYMCPIMWFLMMIMWSMQLLLQLNGSILYKRYGKWKCKNVSVPAGIRNCCIGQTLTCLCSIALHACWLHMILVKEANHSLVNKWKLFNFTEPMLTYDDPMIIVSVLVGECDGLTLLQLCLCLVFIWPLFIGYILLAKHHHSSIQRTHHFL